MCEPEGACKNSSTLASIYGRVLPGEGAPPQNCFANVQFYGGVLLRVAQVYMKLSYTTSILRRGFTEDLSLIPYFRKIAAIYTPLTWPNSSTMKVPGQHQPTPLQFYGNAEVCFSLLSSVQAPCCDSPLTKKRWPFPSGSFTDTLRQSPCSSSEISLLRRGGGAGHI